MQMINLLPREYVSVQKNKILKNILGIGLAIELGVTGIMAVQPLSEIASKQEQLEIINEKLNNPRFDEVKAVKIKLQEVKKNYEDWSNKLSEIKATPVVSGALLDTLLGNLPVGVTIDYLQIEEQSVVIKGKSTNDFSIRGYISKLQNIYLESDMTFELEEIKQGDKYSSFSVQIDLEVASEKEEEGNVE